MSREMKDSGVEWIGEIPENWDVLPIKRNYRIVAGATPKSDKPENWDGEIPWITPSDYKTEDKYILSGKKSITEKGYNSCSTTMVPANSIIFSKRAPVGTVAISANELCTNQGCLSCVPLNKSNSVFGYYSMIAGKNAFEMAALGTTFMEISADAFANMKLPYCGITEQQQIVHFLDRKCTAIDTAIEKTKKSIEKLEEYKKAVITKAVTKGIDPNAKMKDSGVEWIGEIPENWDIRRGKFILKKLSRSVKDSDEVITCFRDGEVTLRKNRREEGFTFSDKEIGYQGIEPGDLVVHGMDGFAGSIGISDSRGKATPVLNVLSSSENKEYYMYYLRSMAYGDVFTAIATGIRVRSCNLNWNKLAELSYPVPDKDTQKQIVNYIGNIIEVTNDLIKKKQAIINKWEEYKKSLIYYAVTGKIDCRNEVI